MSWSDFAQPTLTGIEAPYTATTSANLWGWSSQEKTGLHPAPDTFDWYQWNNPLNTTEKWAGSVNTGAQPGAHDVQAYRSLSDGAAATVATLLNGNYDTIVESLRQNIPAAWWSETARNQLSTWGTGSGWCDYVPIGADVLAQLDDILAQSSTARIRADQILNLITTNSDAGVNGIPVASAHHLYLADQLAAVKTELDAIKAAQVAPPSPDLSAVTAALTTLNARVGLIIDKLNKDLA